MPNTKTVTVENEFSTAKTTLSDKMPAVPLTGPQGMKAIGPRVTFNFISEPWSDDSTYDGYDVVQVAGVSYVAIKPVPTGVQLDNGEYWFKWSEPNAQWQDLMDTVDTFDARIEDANDKSADAMSAASVANLSKKGFTKQHIFWLTDSWGTYQGTAGGSSQFEYQVSKLLNATPHVSAVSNRGYIAQGADGKSFPQFLTDWYNANHGRPGFEWIDTLGYLVVYGSINDYLNPINTIKTAVKNFVSTARELFPNTEIILIPPVSGINRNLPENVGAQNGWYKTYRGVKLGCIDSGATLIDGGYLLFNQNSSLMGPDNLHPSAAGVDALSLSMARAMSGDKVMNNDPFPKSGQLYTDIEITFADEENPLNVNAFAYIDSNNLLNLRIFSTGVNLSQSVSKRPYMTISFPNFVFNYSLHDNQIIAFTTGSVQQYIYAGLNNIMTVQIGSIVNNSIPVNLNTGGASSGLCYFCYDIQVGRLII